jgi:hypothetical protein
MEFKNYKFDNEIEIVVDKNNIMKINLLIEK